MPTRSIAGHFLPPVFLPQSHSENTAPSHGNTETTRLPIVTNTTEPLPDPIFDLIDEPPPRLPVRGPLSNFVEVLRADVISSGRGYERAYNLSEGTALGIGVDEKLYEYDDPYVIDSEIRRAVTGKLQAQGGGRGVVWLETAGVLEYGTGLLGTVGFGTPIVSGNINYGFSVNGLLRFRTSQAFMLGLTQSRNELTKNPSFQIPTTAQQAKLMPFGSEIEITGQGKLHGEFGLSGNVGHSVSMATAGLSLNATGNLDVAKEYSLNVTALDGYSKVRVTTRALDNEVMSLTAMLRAGLIFRPNTLQPPRGAGLLRFLVGAVGYKSIEELVNAYTTVTARYLHSSSRQGTHIASYDFDLGNPQAAKAYENLLKLSLVTAQKLSTISESGVTQVKAEEVESASRNLFDITLLGKKLILAETLHHERSGSLIHDGREIMVYRDSMYKKRFEGWFCGRKEIEWQSVSVIDKKADTTTPYFRLHFFKKEDGVKASQSERFFNFARSMGIHSAELTENLAERTGDYNRILSTAKEVDTDIDIYFSNEGIQRVDEAMGHQAFEAFLKSSSEILPEYKEIPHLKNDNKSRRAKSIMEEYRNLKKNSHWYSCNRSELSGHCDEYWAVTGRDLRKDEKIIKEAEEFANAIEMLKDASNPEQAAAFFLNLGKSKGFDFMQTISALQRLAGHDHTLVHSMAMQGGGIALKSRDEGSIEHPRETIMNVLTRVV